MVYPEEQMPTGKEAQPAETTHGGAISKIISEVRASIKIPADLKDAYRRLVTAGVNIMFQKQTSDMMIKTIKAPGDLGKNVGEGAAGLVMLLYRQAKDAPPKLMVPVGMEFVLQAYEFIEKTNIVAYTKENLGVSVKVMIETVLKSTGANMDKLNEMMGQASAPPAAATELPAAETPQTGMIAGLRGEV